MSKVEKDKEKRINIEEYLGDHKVQNICIRLALGGQTIQDIAFTIGVSISALYRYKDDDDSFKEALQIASEMPIELVERSLFQRARGYSTVETKTHASKEGYIFKEDVIKHYPPDVTAQKYFLGNKNPSKWKDRKEVDLRGLTEMTDDALEKKVGEILKDKQE